jgi:hypothetical protein
MSDLFSWLLSSTGGAPATPASAPTLASVFGSGQAAGAAASKGAGSGGTGAGVTPPASIDPAAASSANPWQGITTALPVDPSVVGWADQLANVTHGNISADIPHAVTPGTAGWLPTGTGYAAPNQQGVQSLADQIQWQVQHYDPTKGGFFGGLGRAFDQPLTGILGALSFPLAVGGGAAALGAVGAGAGAGTAADTASLATTLGLADTGLGKILSIFEGSPSASSFGSITPDPAGSLGLFASELGPTGFDPGMLSGQAATAWGNSGAAQQVASDFLAPAGEGYTPAISPTATPQFFTFDPTSGAQVLNPSALPGWLQPFQAAQQQQTAADSALAGGLGQ